MDIDILVNEAQKYISNIFNGNVDGHDLKHSIRVYNNAILIAQSIPECDIFIISLAALLHDVDDHKLFNTYNNKNARSFLSTHNISNNKIEQICSVINSVSYSQNRGKTPTTIEGKVVQDADRLDAIGAIGIARTFAYNGTHEKTLKASVQHFYDKLLLLKDFMNTDTARQIAEIRHLFMVDFLKELNEETKGFF